MPLNSEPDICNMPSPLFTGLPAMVQILPNSLQEKRGPSSVSLLGRVRSSARCVNFLPMATPTQAPLDQIKLAMAKTNDLFNTEVFRNRNFGALDQIYTTDARILPPGAPLVSGLDRKSTRLN